MEMKKKKRKRNKRTITKLKNLRRKSLRRRNSTMKKRCGHRILINHLRNQNVDLLAPQPAGQQRYLISRVKISRSRPEGRESVTLNLQVLRERYSQILQVLKMNMITALMESTMILRGRLNMINLKLLRFVK